MEPARGKISAINQNLGEYYMLIYKNDISLSEYCKLRSDVGWTAVIDEQAQAGLDHSDFIVSCYDENEIVGCARIFWDKGAIAYLADVMVTPAYQGKGIGKKLVAECIAYIDGQLKEGWRVKIVIVSEKGKEKFYEKFGFQIRPNEKDGAGMNLWREYTAPALNKKR